MSPRDWVIKSEDVWRGWDPELSQYFPEPIMFEGPLLFDKYYEQLVVFDRESGSCNLIWTIRKLITKGAASYLSDTNWISLWLHFSKKTLFKTLIANINADEELSKLRSCMSKLNRRPGEPLQVPLYKLKSYYELLLVISFPQMEADTATIRSDSYSANCAKFFLSKNTGVAV